MFNPEFIEVPLSVNVTTDQVAVFHCEHSTADSIVWKINGANSNNLPYSGSVVNETAIGRSHTLSIRATPQYNATRIECVALSIGSSQSITTAPAELLKQRI